MHYFFLGGKKEEIKLKCLSLPVSFDYGETTLLDHIQTAKYQEFHGYLLSIESKLYTLDKISGVLKNRFCESDYAGWDDFINNLPDKSDYDLGTRYTNIMYQLAAGNGGHVQIPFTYQKASTLTANDLVQPFVFVGGPIRNTKERNALLSQRAKEMNLEHLIIETKKQRNKAPSNKKLKGPTTAKIGTTSTTSSSFSTSNDHIPIVIEPVTKKKEY